MYFLLLQKVGEEKEEYLSSDDLENFVNSNGSLMIKCEILFDGKDDLNSEGHCWILARPDEWKEWVLIIL